MWWPNKFSTHLIRHIDLIIFIAGLISQLFKIHRDGYPWPRQALQFVVQSKLLGFGWISYKGSDLQKVLSFFWHFFEEKIFWPRQALQTQLLGVGWIGRKWAFHNQNSNASTGQRKFVRFFGSRMFKNLIKYVFKMLSTCSKTQNSDVIDVIDKFCKSCVHIYFWLVLGKKYHRVFIKQRDTWLLTM